MKGILIAAPASGSGKTTLTLALMAAYRKRGLSIAPFKVGPDFIDPGHHSHVTGVVSRNLDGWMLSKETNLACFSRHAKDADLAVVEGVMGLFDGYDGKSEAGSSAQMAKWLGLPVLLVVNAKSMARSVAALVQGFERFDPDLTFAGVIFNNVGSPGHLEYLKTALDGNVNMPFLGGILRQDELRMPERHLGLVTAQDQPLSETYVDRLVSILEQSIDLSRLYEHLPDIHMYPGPEPGFTKPIIKDDVRIGVARDKAFCFYYQDNLDLLEHFGAKLIYFSPLDENESDFQNFQDHLDGIYLGGGYPEMYARTISGNPKFRTQLLSASQAGMPIYAECGGFMVLCKQLIDQHDQAFPMAGCFPFTARMYPRLQSLGYRQVCLSQDTLLGPKGTRLRGHEFHYSQIAEVPAADHDHNNFKPDSVYQVESRKGAFTHATGYMTQNTMGSYIHLHFASCPQAARNFVDACRDFKNRSKQPA